MNSMVTNSSLTKVNGILSKNIREILLTERLIDDIDKIQSDNI